MMDYQALGQKVRFVRKQKNMTQEQLAEAVGISASFLGHIERGTRVASLETLVALCNTLNTTPEYLLSASLNNSLYQMPTGFSDGDRTKLSHFLRMAEATVLGWKDE